VHQVYQALVQGLVFGSIYGIAAIGFALVYNATMVFHVAYGALVNVGALLAIGFGAEGRADRLFVTIPLAMLIAAVIGALVYLSVYRPMLRRGAKPITVFVASLGLNLAISAVLQLVYGPATRHFDYPALFRTHRIAGADLSYLGITCIATGILVAAVLVYLLRRTLLGQQIRAVGSSAEIAQLAGVRTIVVLAGVFALSSAIAAICGVLLGMQTSVAPPVNPTLTLLAAVAVLLAGRGSYTGAYLAGIMLGVVQALAGVLLPGECATATVFAVFVAVALTRPQGLLAGRLA
jgi:branched-chain amino acid transport system permease protein